MLGFGNKKREQAVQDEKAFVSGELVKFGGFNGNRLLTAIVFTATVGFSLFGYDQGKSLPENDDQIIQILIARFNVWYYRCQNLQR